jgi:hypothetical protein
MTRTLSLLACALTVALAGCTHMLAPDQQPRSESHALSEARTLNDITGSYHLRAPIANATGLPYPASLPHLAAVDSVTAVAGVFTLRADKTWDVKVQSEVFLAGQRGQSHTHAESGNFAITEQQAGRVVLSLYPGRMMTADRPWTLSVTGDTLRYGNLVFVR